MIDFFTIFTKTGLVLWSHRVVDQPLKGDPVNSFIGDVLLEERSGDTVYFGKTPETASYGVKWSLGNEAGLVAACVYQKLLAPLYVDELVRLVLEKFTDMFGTEIAAATGAPDAFCEAFDSVFDGLLRSLETSKKKKKEAKKPRSFAEAKAKKMAERRARKKREKEERARNAKLKDSSNSNNETTESVAYAADESDDFEAQRAKALERLKSRKEKGAKKNFSKSGKGKNDTSSPKKKKRDWKSALHGREEEGDVDSLDFTKRDASDTGGEDYDADESDALFESQMKEYLPGGNGVRAEIDESDGDSDSADEDGDESDGEMNSKKKSSWSVGSFFKSLTGNKELTAADLTPCLTSMKQALVGRNVAVEVTDQLCASVRTALVGQKLGAFARVDTAVRKALEEALLKVLTPKKSIDVLRSALQAKREGRPYVITFIGVNGVGKSTSLAKVTYYLRSKGLKPLIVACDTFRSGAVEQLKVHARCLDVHLFERGYAKDPAGLAMDAVAHAKANGYDVVLIDTAGRMQNNDPAMRALAKLVDKNKPDLVLFVGEALVGNDGVDQLHHFNKSLKDYSMSGATQKIDGMVLTKFDTVDEKVGAAVSMVHKTGQPIIFVGTGQKYTNLNKLNVRKILATLMA